MSIRDACSWMSAVFIVLAAAVRPAEAQDKSDALDDLKKRVEALEAEQAAEAPGDEGTSGAPGTQDVKWYDRVKVGGGIRAHFRSEEPATGSNYSNDVSLHSGRLYLSGTITDQISGELNFDFTDEDSGANEQPARVLDAVGKIKIQDEIQIWAGRFLPPSDRSNLDGPYFITTWDYPDVSMYHQIYAGRDNGLMLWGDLEGGRYAYHIGLFEGRDNVVAGGSDQLEVAARIEASLLDPEPGYYTMSTYYGDHELLSIGLAAQYQSDVEGVAADPEDYVAFNVDVLFEKAFDFGVLTAEGAVYSYDRGDYDGSGVGFLVLLAYLYPEEIGWGKFQPHIRFQNFDEEDAAAGINPTKDDVERIDFGLNYVISGHNARISLVYTLQDFETEPPGGPTSRQLDHMLVLGTQFQF